MTGIGPPAIEDLIRERVFLDVEIVDVRNFQLATTGRLQAADLLKYGCVIQIASEP